MNYKYEELMEENDLTLSELPEDAKTGIDEIKAVEKAIRMLEKSGKKPSARALKKLATLDKWVQYEIMDYLHDTDKNEDDMPFEAEDIIDDLGVGAGAKKDEVKEDEVKEDEVVEADPLGLSIEQELDILYQSGKKSFTIDDLAEQTSKTYDVLFDNYEDDEENGIVTTKYSLIENKEGLFTLKLN